jgi:hypothetical protein
MKVQAQAAKAARKQAAVDRAGKAEEERQAVFEATRAKAASGRRELVSGRLLSDKAAACTKKQAPGRTARVNKRKRDAKALKEREEALESEQIAFAAERQAFEQKQQASGRGLDRSERARAASAAVPDQLRHEHKRQVATLERGLDSLIRVPAQPRFMAASLAAAGAGVVSDLRKIRADKQQRDKREREQTQSRQGKAIQSAQWTQNHLANQRPQRKLQKLSNQHKVAKQKDRQRRGDQHTVGGQRKGKGKGKGK